MDFKRAIRRGFLVGKQRRAAVRGRGIGLDYFRHVPSQKNGSFGYRFPTLDRPAAEPRVTRERLSRWLT